MCEINLFFFQFNFVGRILGPRGMTTKQLEQETGCKIMVRGKGSMRDKKKVNFGYFWLILTIYCRIQVGNPEIAFCIYSFKNVFHDTV